MRCKLGTASCSTIWQNCLRGRCKEGGSPRAIWPPAPIPCTSVPGGRAVDGLTPDHDALNITNRFVALGVTLPGRDLGNVAPIPQQFVLQNNRHHLRTQLTGPPSRRQQPSSAPRRLRNECRSGAAGPLGNPTSPLGRRWFKAFLLQSSPLPLRGEVYPSPLPPPLDLDGAFRDALERPRWPKTAQRAGEPQKYTRIAENHNFQIRQHFPLLIH